MTFRIADRSEWTSRPPTTRVAHRITSNGAAVDEVYLHHSAGGATPFFVRMLAIQGYHMDHKEWYDFAYNAAVSNTERLAANGRGPLTQSGATYGHNEDSLSLVAIGDYETEGKDNPSPDLISNIIDLLAEWIRSGYVSPFFELKPHNAVSATACCGKRLIPYIPTIEAKAKQQAADTPEPAPGMTDAQKLAAIAEILAA